MNWIAIFTALTVLLSLASCSKDNTNLSDSRFTGDEAQSAGSSDDPSMGLIKEKGKFIDNNKHSTPFSANMEIPFVAQTENSNRDKYAVYRVPTMVVHTDPKGKQTILAFAEGRVHGHADEGDIDIVLRRSEDGGRNWEPLQILVNHGKNPCKDQSPVVLPNGRIRLLYLWNKHIKSGNESDRTTCDTYMIYSDDAGKTWSNSGEKGTVGFGDNVYSDLGKDITDQTQIMGKSKDENWLWTGLGPVHGIVKKFEPNKGRIIFPARHSTKGNPTVAHVIYSDDNGKNWNIGGSVSKIRTTESTVVELSDGRIMLNSRKQNVANSDGKHLRVVSISRDGGISFPEAKSYEAEKLIEPKGVQASLLYHSYNKKTKKGNILFSNPANMENRCNGTLRLSTDDAKTWSQEYVYAPNTCENKYFTGYSDLALFPNGNVGVLYERGNDFNDSEVRYEEIGFTVVRIQPNR